MDAISEPLFLDVCRLSSIIDAKWFCNLTNDRYTQFFKRGQKSGLLNSRPSNKGPRILYVIDKESGDTSSCILGNLFGGWAILAEQCE